VIGFGREPRIFISYRRDDSAVHARALYEELEGFFGRDQVFYDVEDIELGDRFGEIIEHNIGRCDVVVCVIGPSWLTLAGADGMPRIRSERDVVRREVAAALKLRKRLIPVLVGGASLPDRAALPPDIAALCDTNVLTVSDRQLGAGSDQLVQAIRRRRSTRELLDVLRRRTAHGLGLAAALTMVCAGWVGLFDFLTLDTKAASYMLWLADLMSPVQPSPQVRRIVIDENTERVLGRPFKANPAARRDHAVLIDKLAQAGARVVAFDIFFTRVSPADDAVLARAIEHARAKGTSVVLGARELEGGEPLMVPALRAAAGDWAMLCFGQRLGYANTVPLVSQSAADGSGAAPGRVRAVGLALAAALPGPAQMAEGRSRVIVSGDGGRNIREFAYSQLEPVADPQQCPVVQPGDRVAAAIYRAAPLAALQDPQRRHKYEQVLSLGAPELQQRFGGKTVLVGLEMAGEDVFSTFHGWHDETRHGLALHADATSALLQGAGVIVEPVSLPAQWALMVVLGLFGSRLRLWQPQGRPWLRGAALAAAALLCLAAALALCLGAALLLNATYQVGALLLGYGLGGRAAK
jgi:CHASE2 domain-containing sensor protein